MVLFGATQKSYSQVLQNHGTTTSPLDCFLERFFTKEAEALCHAANAHAASPIACLAGRLTVTGIQIPLSDNISSTSKTGPRTRKKALGPS